MIYRHSAWKNEGKHYEWYSRDKIASNSNPYPDSGCELITEELKESSVPEYLRPETPKQKLAREARRNRRSALRILRNKDTLTASEVREAVELILKELLD